MAGFIGQEKRQLARKAAAVTVVWSVASGFLLMGLLLLLQEPLALLLVPPDAMHLIAGGWLISSLCQPVNGLCFATDGVHWGTGDYGFMRNTVVLATLAGVIGLRFIDTAGEDCLALVWLVTVCTITLRGILGLLRIWPGFGRAPLKTGRQ